MIEEILPAEVAAAEALADPPGVTLFPEEEAVIAKAVDKRRREFSTVRQGMFPLTGRWLPGCPALRTTSGNGPASPVVG